jgi:hypothetical protein
VSENKEPGNMPGWLAYGVPFVLAAGGIISAITKTFWIAGGSRGGSSYVTGMTAMWSGIGMAAFGVLMFFFFRYVGRKG